MESSDREALSVLELKRRVEEPERQMKELEHTRGELNGTKDALEKQIAQLSQQVALQESLLAASIRMVCDLTARNKFLGESLAAAQALNDLNQVSISEIEAELSSLHEERSFCSIVQ